MSVPKDTVTPGPIPTEPGFYWRRQFHFGDRGDPGWRWVPAEVYRPYPGGESAPLMTNDHGLENVTWGPRIDPPQYGNREGLATWAGFESWSACEAAANEADS